MITFSRNPKVIGDNDIPELSLRSEEKVKVIEDKLWLDPLIGDNIVL